MTEEQRKEYTQRVNNLFELVKRKNEIIGSIEQYERENRHVQDYLRLCRERMELSYQLPKSFNQSENQSSILQGELNYNLINFGEIRQNTNKCKHPIWLYVGSECGFGFGRRQGTEDDPDFNYNSYRCIECGEIFCVNRDDYRDFEERNIVLKNYELKSAFYEILVEYYYSSLMDNSPEESIKELERFFEHNVKTLSMKK